MDVAGANAPVSLDSAHFVMPRKGWLKLHQHPARSVVLLVAGLVTVVAGLVGAVRRVAEFQRLDFHTVRAAEGYQVISVSPRSGAARAGLTWGDVIVSLGRQ